MQDFRQILLQVFFQNIEVEKIFDKQGSLVQKNKTSGLIWVLQGKRYSLSRASELMVKLGQSVTRGSILSKKQMLNKCSGLVKVENFIKKSEIGILSFSLILQNAKILQNDQIFNTEKNILELDNQKKVHLKVRHNEIIQQNHLLILYKLTSKHWLSYERFLPFLYLRMIYM